ncbi:MAG: hypothetical protein WBF52_04345, partial [Geitlerinemataceae cyanobacterium]
MTYFKEACYVTFIALKVNLFILSPVWAQAILKEKTVDRESVTDMEKILKTFVSNKHELSFSNWEPQFAESQVIPTSKALHEQRSSNETFKKAQVLNVNDLEDVSPAHWAYEALRSLVEKYQCLSGSSENI